MHLHYKAFWIATYEVLLALWEECKDSKLDSEIRTKIIGVETQMLSFEFLFGVSLGAVILSHYDNLSKTLRHISLSAAEGQHMPKLTLQVFKSIHQADKFDLFYQRVLLDQQYFTVNPPILPDLRLVLLIVITTVVHVISLERYIMKHWI